MPMTTVISHSPSTVSPSSLNYSAIRFVRMEAERVEHQSSIPRLLTPEEVRGASRSPPSVHEDATPLDFSRPSTSPVAAAKEPSPHSPSYGGAVDLCTRGAKSPDIKTEELSNAEDGRSCNTSSVPISRDSIAAHVPQQTLPSAVQHYPFHSAMMHAQHQQYVIGGPTSAPQRQPSPQMTVPESTAVNSIPATPQTTNFQGIISLTPPPALPLSTPMPAALPLSPIPQPPMPPILPAPLHQTLAAANACKSDSSSKATRPFKAYPKDPLTLTVGVSTAESLLGQASNEAYVEFRKRMLQQVAATKARRPNSAQQSEESSNCEESPESQPQNNQSSSSGDEDGTPSSKKRSRTNSESNSPFGVVKDAAYWERRRKNNEAAKRSRDARRAKEDEIAIRAAFLEQENLRLKYEVAALRHETSNLRCLLYSAANSS
ncbi:hypothetical protein J437_LFUL007190 [Ladona fulva]|uniref:BZIP domain-containing protein n=1 Tax=Ladona fulva TaxID=123851 RepID=A0A8K0K606_LADFU|nr:hypothetical protein J437_LFUL007190 [Ladona fulva]